MEGVYEKDRGDQHSGKVREEKKRSKGKEKKVWGKSH